MSWRHALHRRRTTPAEYRRRYRTRSGRWLLQLYEELMQRESHWMGVRALKNPLDAWVYQEILYEVRPTAIVELGSAAGGSALFLCHMLDLLELDAQLVSVDISHAGFDAEHPRITTLTGDTRDPAIVAAVAERCEGRKVMVIHDADHNAPVVLEDLRNYAPLVSPGSYLIVEDGVRDFLGGEPGPVTALRRYLAETDAFELDERREKFLLTYNPRGFLRRVR